MMDILERSLSFMKVSEATLTHKSTPRYFKFNSIISSYRRISLPNGPFPSKLPPKIL